MCRSLLAVLTLVILVGCSSPARLGDVATPMTAASSSNASPDSTESTDDAASAADETGATGPLARAAAKPVIQGVPAVMLTAMETGLCKLGVGDELPDLELPTLDGGSARLSELRGERATVVVFWSPDLWMARWALADIERDVARRAEARGVRVIGVAVGERPETVRPVVEEAKAEFTQLVDAEGTSVAECGSAALPRIYVLTADRVIAWFDIEYSETTRRELQQALEALAPFDS